MSAKKAAVITLKWPVFIPSAAPSRYLKYTAVRTANGETECSVFAVLVKGKWICIPEQLVWIREDCIVSRQYIDQVPKQVDLHLC